MDNEKKQVTYNSSFSGETQVTLDIQQYMNNKAMYIGLMCNEDGYDEPFGDVTVNLSVARHRGMWWTASRGKGQNCRFWRH